MQRNRHHICCLEFLQLICNFALTGFNASGYFESYVNWTAASGHWSDCVLGNKSHYDSGILQINK